MPQLALYYFDFCPYCLKVRRYLEQNNIRVTMRNTMIDSGAREELLHIGGKTQVPCLVIDGKALYESDDIIQWFQENYRHV